jgi:hypothetical protein
MQGLEGGLQVDQLTSRWTVQAIVQSSRVSATNGSKSAMNRLRQM